MARLRKPVTCKKCGASGLWWKKVGSWRLMNADDATLHVCNGPGRPIGSNPFTVDPSGEPIPAPGYDPNALAQPAASTGAASAGNAVLAMIEAIDARVNAQIDAKIDAKLDALDLSKLAGSAPIGDSPTIIVEMPNSDTPAVVIEGAHKQTAHVLKYIAALGASAGIYMVGPAGSGKTQAAESIAEALFPDRTPETRFYPQSVGAQTSKSDLLGYMQPQLNGPAVVVRTILRDAFEYGGLFLLDEIDAGNANVLTILNAALANGYCSFPDAVVKRHADFRVIAAGNTYGHGASRQYVGRNQLDAASLDRFVPVEWDYDMAIEASIQRAHGVSGWAEYVWALRAAQTATGTRVILSTRSIVKGCKLLAAGIDRGTVAQLAIWGNVSADDRAKLEAFAA